MPIKAALGGIGAASVGGKRQGAVIIILVHSIFSYSFKHYVGLWVALAKRIRHFSQNLKSFYR